MARASNLLANAVPRLILGSPLHRLMSGAYLTLHFRGRRTQRKFDLPVAYRWHCTGIVISTDSGWWVNLIDREFTVTLRGRRRVARAVRLADEEALAALQSLLEIRGYARAAGIDRENGQISDSALRRSLEQRVVLELSVVGER